MHKIRHIRQKINNNWKLEVLSVLVVVLSLVVMGSDKTVNNVQALVLQSIVMNSGDEVQIGCRDGQVPTTSLSGLVVRVRCALLAATPTATPTPAQVANLVSNGDFSGGTLDWTVSGVTVTNGIATLTGSAYFSQPINQKLQTGQTYVVSADVLVTSPGNITWGGPQLALGYYPDLGDSSLGFTRASRTTTGWQRLTMERTINSLSRTVYVGVRNFGFNGVAQVDNVRVVVKGTTVSLPTPTTPAGVVSTPTSTTRPTATSTVAPPVGGGGAGNSKAYGLWTPYVNAAGVTVDTCTKEDHDKWFVVGPDGRRYPTWHPPVDPAKGCTYGHDHGQNPANFASWDRLRRQYAYDANSNGTIDSAELAVSGIPFGLANETLVDWTSLTGSTIAHRHEDHQGHKIHFMNAEPMERYGQFIPEQNASARIATPMRCDLFGKLHMGVTTKDAFTNNLHEFISYQNCTDSSNSANNYEVGTVFLAKFGKPGEFLASCIGSPNEKRDQCGDGLIKLDYFNTSPTYPGSCSDGSRAIVDWNCVQQMALVPAGQFTFNFYEIWSTRLALLRPNGSAITVQDGAALEVNDAIRYFDPRVADFNGKVVDLCKITGTRQMRGNPCDQWREAGSPAWDDPRSPMTGTNRAMYYVPFVINNGGGATTYCANPFGEQATAVSGACPKGYMKQYVSTKNFNFANAYGSGSNTENSQTVQSDFGARGVHAPN